MIILILTYLILYYNQYHLVYLNIQNHNNNINLGNLLSRMIQLMNYITLVMKFIHIYLLTNLLTSIIYNLEMRDIYLLRQNNINFLNLQLNMDMNKIHPKNLNINIHHSNFLLMYMKLIFIINMLIHRNMIHHYNYFYPFM